MLERGEYKEQSSYRIEELISKHRFIPNKDCLKRHQQPKRHAQQSSRQGEKWLNVLDAFQKSVV